VVAAVTDSQGADLVPGDPILYYFSDGNEATPATVLRALPDNRYSIQLDRANPRRGTDNPHLASLEARLEAAQCAAEDRINALLRANGQSRLDSQDPFEVDGAELLFFRGWA
jgi:hypothetical protein